MRDGAKLMRGNQFAMQDHRFALIAITLNLGDLDRHKIQRYRDQCKRSEEHTSELQSLMRISYAVFRLKKKQPSYSKKTLLNSSHYLPHCYTTSLCTIKIAQITNT